MSVYIHGKKGEMTILRSIKRIIKELESSPIKKCKYIEELPHKIGFSFSLDGKKYSVYRPDHVTVDTEDITITGIDTDYLALIQVKNVVTRSITPMHTRSFVDKLLEEEADDGLFISLSSPVRGEILKLLDISYTPIHPDDYWEEGIRLFIQDKLGSKSLKRIDTPMQEFHKTVDSFLGLEQGWRFRDFPTDFNKRLSWLLGFRIPTKTGEFPHISPSAILYQNLKRYLFFIAPKEMRMDHIRSWHLQHTLLNAQVVLGIPPKHSFYETKKLKKIKALISLYKWIISPMESTSKIQNLYVSVQDIAQLPFYNDRLIYSKEKPFRIHLEFDELPPCFRRAYQYGVSDGRYSTTLLLSILKDLAGLEIQDKFFYSSFAQKCYRAANRAMLAKKKDKKVEVTLKTRYYPIRRKFGYLNELPCNFDGGIWMGAQAIDRVYNQRLCQPDEVCLQMEQDADIISYLKIQSSLKSILS